jgi:hypothetical protein
MLRTLAIHPYAHTVLASVALSAFVSSSRAQSPEIYHDTPPGPFHQPVSPLPVEMGFTQHHSSTSAEGFLRGKAAVIQAHGNFRLSEAQAQILRQQARWLDRENDLLQTQALLAQKKMWDDARAAERKEQEARRIEGQQLLATRQATVYRQVYQLSTDEFDSITGAITWPTVLQNEYFDRERERVTELVRQQFAYGEPKPATAFQVNRAVEKLADSLRTVISEVPRDEYLAAQKFLTGLRYTTESLSQNNVDSRVAKQ